MDNKLKLIMGIWLRETSQTWMFFQCQKTNNRNAFKRNVLLLIGSKAFFVEEKSKDFAIQKR